MRVRMDVVSLFACVVIAGCSDRPALGVRDSGAPPSTDAPGLPGPPTDAALRDAAGDAPDGIPGDAPGDAPSDAPGHVPGTPGLGAHGIAFYHVAESQASTIQTPALALQPSGSTIIVGVGRGDKQLFALPTDTKGNAPYQQLGPIRPYVPLYPQSGTALYAFPSAIGGAGVRVTTTTGPSSTGQRDEITIAAVEVIEGTRIQAFEWNEPTAPPLTSNSVTTTGPATLIAFWWGDGYPDTTPQAATPNNGFAVIETNVQELHAFVQCAVAVKNVAAAGTYNVTWTATPVQGAQLWLVAVQ
jgi:hypothetical protein